MKSVLLGVASILAAFPIAAQNTESHTGSRLRLPSRARIPEAGKLSDSDRGRVAMAQFARCLVTKNMRGVERSVEIIDGAFQDKALASLATPDCLYSGMMRFQPAVLRGALFVELLRQRDVRPNAMPRLAAYDLKRGDGATESLRVHWWLIDLADCVVARDAAAARAYSMSAEASDAETAAFGVLKPSLGPCVTSGQAVALNRAVLKASMAEVLYRGVPAASVASASEGKN